MFTTISVHLDVEDSTVEANEDNSGIVIHDIGSFDPRLVVFLGNTPEAIRRNGDAMIEAIQQLKVNVRVGR